MCFDDNMYLWIVLEVGVQFFFPLSFCEQFITINVAKSLQRGNFFSKLNSTNVIIKVFIIMFGVDNTRGMCLLMEGLGTMMLVVSKVGIDEISCF